MTTTIAPGSAAPAGPVASRPVPVRSSYRFELVKLLSQWRVRLLIAACWIVPAVGVYLVSHEQTLPADTLYGRWLHATGLAAPLAALSFAGNWLLPLVTSIIAGDVFSVEDRLGTWRHLLVAVRSPRRIFAAKALASLTVIAIGFPGLAVSATAGGIAASGLRPLAGMDGLQLTPGDALARIALVWACALAPTLALAAIGAGHRAITLGIAPLAGLFAVSAAVLALAAPGTTGSGIDEHKVETALATEFANLYPVQIGEIYHQAINKSQLGVTAVCDRGGGLISPAGPGNDWRCTVSWQVPDVSDATGQAIYQLDVNPNGRFVADGDGPKEVNGYFLVRAPYGDAPNPLWQFDGNVDLLATSTKG